MKKIEMMLQPEQLERVRAIIEEVGVVEYYLTDWMKNNTHKNTVKKYRGAEYQVKQIAQVKIEMVLTDEMVAKVVQGLKEGNTSDSPIGKLIMYDVQELVW